MSKQSFKITEESMKDEMDEYNVVMTPNAIPDLNSMSSDILELLDFIESDSIATLEDKFLDEYKMANLVEDQTTEHENNLKSINSESPEYDKTLQQILELKRKTAKLRKSADKKKEDFESIIFGKYNSRLPMKIISLMIERERYENLNELLDMFEVLKDVKAGKKDINDEAEKFGEKNRSKYVYPTFGGKDGFYSAMTKSK